MSSATSAENVSPRHDRANKDIDPLMLIVYGDAALHL
jgi:hypothetical protein